MTSLEHHENAHTITPRLKRKGIKMRQYEWTVEASGIIEATSDEEAKEILLNDADGLVADDRKYWSHKIDGVGV